MSQFERNNIKVIINQHSKNKIKISLPELPYILEGKLFRADNKKRAIYDHLITYITTQHSQNYPDKHVKEIVCYKK